MISNNKIFILVPDGVGIKNYLYTDVFNGLEQYCTLLHNFDFETIEYLKSETNIKNDIVLPGFKETLTEKFYRELICILRLRINAKKTGNNTILNFWKNTHKGLSKKLFYGLIKLVSIVINKYKMVLTLEKKYQKSLTNNPFYSKSIILLKKERPDTIFCAHQRDIKAAVLVEAAKELNIKTITVVYSWDNLPKARLAVKANLYLVWSEYMKKEMQLYYPEIDESNIYITGTPQFEHYYKKENLIPKQTFYHKYGLDPSKKIICFSGDDEKTSPDDPSYLTDLANALETSGLDKYYQIALRRCPVDISGRFISVVKQYPDLIIEINPSWRFEGKTHWTAVYPDKLDVSLLVSTVFYSDIVINVGSTMAFDFAMFEKPCIFINYDQKSQNDTNWTVTTIYQFQHFRTMPNQPAVFWLNDKREISNLIKKITFAEVKDGMDLWKKTVLGDFQYASIRINKLLKN